MIKLDKFIQGINNKDPRAWKELYRFYYGALCNYSSSIINETSVAEDIVQECLIMIWKSDLNFQNIKILSSYLYKSVYNNTLKYIRDKKVEDKRKSEWSSTLSETEDDIFYMAAEEDVIRKLRAAIALLPCSRNCLTTRNKYQHGQNPEKKSILVFKRKPETIFQPAIVTGNLEIIQGSK